MIDQANLGHYLLNNENSARKQSSSTIFLAFFDIRDKGRKFLNGWQ